MTLRPLLAALLAGIAFATSAAAVDVNSASRADLEAVKGIGPGLAGKIVDARQTAPFKSWADLVDRVGGMGPGNAARLSQAGLTVGGAGYSAAAAASAPAPKREKKAG